MAARCYGEAALPPFEPHSGNLPPGQHPATWADVLVRFGGSAHRRQLLYGLRRFFLDGSFVTAKEFPDDWDGCWDVEGVDVFALLNADPLLWDDAPGRANQRARYGGDLFPTRFTDVRAERLVLEQFQVVYAAGEAKGIVVLDLEAL